MKNSAIQWCDHTFNPWIGCTKVAPECKNCYAETLMDKRWRKCKWGKGQPRMRTSAANWSQPLKWNRESERAGVQRKVFCASLADVFDEEVDVNWRLDLFSLILQTPNLIWQILTKRPKAAKRFLDYGGMPPYENVWLGASAGVDPLPLLEIPAPVHFLSCEPMLHGMDTTHAARFNWIIFGGESGKNARPCHVDWIRQGIAFCRASSIAPFVKQLGRVVITNGVTVPGQHWPRTTGLRDTGKGYFQKHLIDSHGGNMEEWPKDLRVREFPTDIR